MYVCTDVVTVIFRSGAVLIIMMNITMSTGIHMHKHLFATGIIGYIMMKDEVCDTFPLGV